MIGNAAKCSSGSKNKTTRYLIAEDGAVGEEFAFAARAFIGQSALGRLDANLTQHGF